MLFYFSDTLLIHTPTLLVLPSSFSRIAIFQNPPNRVRNEFKNASNLKIILFYYSIFTMLIMVHNK